MRRSIEMVNSVDSVKDSEDIKNNEKSMLMLNDAAQSAAKLTELWPLTEARHLDNDAKYAENLEVRSMRAIARILTNLDVTVPDAEFVYEGADEIPGRPQEIVDALLAAADAYDNMDSCYEPNYDEAEEEILENSNNINSIFSKIASHSAEDSNAINAAADTLNVEGNWSINNIDFAINYAKQMVSCYENKSLETQKIIVVLSLLTNLIKKTNEICETLPIFLYINEICECAGLPRMMFKDAQWREIVDCVRNSSDKCNCDISALVNFISPLLISEWEKHREDVLWDPEVAKKLAKEEDDRKSREALAAKFAHVEGNKESTQALD